MNLETRYDVIIVGGSTAGLSAALTLGRSLRNVLVIDSGKPCNRQTLHSHNFMSRDGETPAQLLAIARRQVLAYPTVTFLNGKAITLTQNAVTFAVTTDQNDYFEGRKVLLATGVEDLMPPIDGVAESWGRSVLHCPYCHGYEVHGQPLGVMINGDQTLERVSLIRNWSQNLTLFTNGPATLSNAHRDTIRQLTIPIVETPITKIVHKDGFMDALQLQDGSRVRLTALFANLPFRQHSDLAQQLNCALTPAGHLAVSAFGETSVPGLFAAGDNTTFMRSLAAASAGGAMAAASLNRELVTEDVAAL